MTRYKLKRLSSLWQKSQGLGSGKLRLPKMRFKPKAETATKPRVESATMLLDAARADIHVVLRFLKTTQDGLSESQVKIRQKHYGLNEVAHQRKASWIVELLLHFAMPFNILLLSIAVVSYLTHSIAATIVIVIMVLLSVSLRFLQEARSSKAAEKLQALVSTTATVYRTLEPEDNEDDAPPKLDNPMTTAFAVMRHEVPMKYLVPGDIIHLSSGDMIPADVRLITAKDLQLAEAALTGEALPVEKMAEPERTIPQNPLELKNICFMGTHVISGAATAVVLMTGTHTVIGSLSKNLVGKPEVTSFDQGMSNLSWLLIRYIIILVSFIFIINGITKGNWLEAFMFALSVAVGLTPEMLPMIVTTNLAKGALAMAKKKVIVKRLNSIQNFGAMDILCTDKTGTLTQNRIILDKPMSIEGHESERLMRYAYLNSAYQTGLKSLMDDAVLQHADELAPHFGLAKHFSKVDEIPFDFERRRMSVIVEEDHETHLLICKGAVEEIFRVSSQAENEAGEVTPIDDTLRATLLAVTQDLNEDGFRVIALAYKQLPVEKTEYTAADESDLTLLGYISFLDPPKETAPRAISALNHHGVQVKILTGDNDIVTRKVCRDVGFKITNVVLGHEIEALSDKKLPTLLDSANVFAKLTPKHKERIIRALRKQGHVVGFLGDGINDAPALKAADVGISVDSAVDIAKESADIILLEKNLMVLEEGVLEGRMVFGNIMKYIRMTMSSNFGNVFSMVGASALLPFLPMLPIHILIQNLLYDFSQTGIPLDNVDEEYLTKPRKWEISNISRFMLFFGPISSIFDFATFGFLWFVMGANMPAHQSLFQTGWFVEGLLSQTIIIHMIRTSRIPFVQSTASPPLLLLTIVVMGIGLIMPFTPLAKAIGMVPLPGLYFVWLAAVLVVYSVVTQLMKRWFIKQFGYN